MSVLMARDRMRLIATSTPSSKTDNTQISTSFSSPKSSEFSSTSLLHPAPLVSSTNPMLSTSLKSPFQSQPTRLSWPRNWSS